MTSACTLGAPAPPRRRPSARALALVLVLANAATSGCGAHAPAHRSEPTERRPTAKLSPREEQTLEAREQMALDPQEPYWPYRQAQIQLESDSLAAAEAALKASLRCDPSYAASLSLLSMLYYDAGRHAEAIALLEFARTRPGAFPDGVPLEILAGLALHYEALGRHDLAAAIMADAEKSRSGGARSAAAYLTLRGEAAGSAADRAAAALEENPKSAANQNNFGITKLRAGDPKAARKAFLRAIELDPKLPGPYYNLAILERYYLFDDAAATRWLAAYRVRAGQDPDGLFGDIEKAEPKPVAKEGR